MTITNRLEFWGLYQSIREWNWSYLTGAINYFWAAFRFTHAFKKHDILLNCLYIYYFERVVFANNKSGKVFTQSKTMVYYEYINLLCDDVLNLP